MYEITKMTDRHGGVWHQVTSYAMWQFPVVGIYATDAEAKAKIKEMGGRNEAEL